MDTLKFMPEIHDFIISNPKFNTFYSNFPCKNFHSSPKIHIPLKPSPPKKPKFQPESSKNLLESPIMQQNTEKLWYSTPRRFTKPIIKIPIIQRNSPEVQKYKKVIPIQNSLTVRLKNIKKFNSNNEKSWKNNNDLQRKTLPYFNTKDKMLKTNISIRSISSEKPQEAEKLLSKNYSLKYKNELFKMQKTISLKSFDRLEKLALNEKNAKILDSEFTLNPTLRILAMSTREAIFRNMREWRKSKFRTYDFSH